MTIETDQLAINAIRTLSIDAIEKANSGHPGLPMGAAPMAYTLWTKHLRHNPANPKWYNRDRFVLSAGHGSMLLYSLLHLGGYNLDIEDIKNFRQWNSKTPGHPEYGHTVGVEATTGPLGQGIAMTVGMAMAERHLATKYNKEDVEIVDHYTFALCGDGDLMEGVASESISLAGHLKLEKLIILYDSNDISLDGDLEKSFSENIQKRFESYGWNYLKVYDGTDINTLNVAIEQAKQNKGGPTLIEVKTVIGYGSPNKSGKADSHGSPLGKDETVLTKQIYGWEHEAFNIPDEVFETFKSSAKVQGEEAEAAWNNKFETYKSIYPELAAQFVASMNNKLPANIANSLPTYETGTKIATRSSSGEAINALAKSLPSLFGGSSDLAGSNKTYMRGEGDFGAKNYAGRNIWFGVREFAMGATLNGMALHGGVNVFGGTFFVFSDYLRPAVRLAALMELPVIYVMTHDSIAVGEDGPTHEPIEQLSSFRAMPNLSVIRPADGNETTAAWELAVSSTSTPTMLVLSRQDLPVLENTKTLAKEGVARGAYVVSPSTKEIPDAILIATGSEVSLAVEAQKSLLEEGINASVVSMPSMDRFDKQSAEYKESVLPKAVTKRLAIEMGASFGWHKYTGFEGDILAIDKFGASAPGEILIGKYGFTIENIVQIMMKGMN